MEFVGQLWLPILLSAVFVFIMSSIVWTLLPHHKNEFQPAPNTDGIQAALKGAAPGTYMFPMHADPKQRRSKEAMQKYAEGPSGLLTLMAPGPMNMGKMMAQSLVLNLVVSFFTAYVAGHVLAMGGPTAPNYLTVFRVVGTIGFMAYGFGPLFESVWFGKPWGSQALNLFDSLLYGLLTAGTFGWLWPR